MARTALLLCLLAAIAQPGDALLSEDQRKQSLRMLGEIEADSRHAASFLAGGKIGRSVMAAMAKAPRHEFVPSSLKGDAYENIPLPIGFGQTISQPFIVALMTDLLETKKDDVVLEIGTGSGYQAAVLAELVKKVYTIEIIEELGKTARERLNRLGYRNIEVRVADGYFGWEENAPFDSIIVTASAGHVPPPLIKQLKPGGKIVIPIGGAYQVQMLMVVAKDASGKLSTRQIIPVRFVPLTGKIRP